MARRIAYAAVFTAVLWAGAALTAIHILCDDTTPDW